ncbi:MAG: hypothetical protein JSU72_17555 [Deltaproteobacteria bacterium]|nr:MAG: hypothetical protein JSU72_17555 [Deltaproteobacteria bacterium]
MFRRVIPLATAYLDEAYFNPAMVQNLQSKREETIENLYRAIEVNPNNAKAKKYLLRFKSDSRNDHGPDELANERFGFAWPGSVLDTRWLRYC